MIRNFICLAALALYAGLAALPVSAQEGSTAAKQAIMLDYDTGTVMFEKNADERMPTSSMSKTMTLYMVFDALKNGQLKLDSTLPVSEKAWRMGGSKMFVEVGKQVSVEDLIRGVAVQSGNDATIVLAEGLAMTEEGLADLMNAKAQALGMENTHLVNASGWPDPEHYSTARDLAILARHLISDFPDYYPYFAEQEFTFSNIKQPNRNPLLYRNIGADGIKTGHTEAGGYGLMASGTRDGRRVILVVNGLSSEKERADESTRLLDWGLRSFENLELFKAGETIADAPVVLGQSENAPLTIKEDLLITLPLAVRNDLKVEAVFKTPLVAPVRKGDPVGTLRVSVPRTKAQEVTLIAAQDIEALGRFSSIFAKARLLLSGAAE